MQVKKTLARFDTLLKTLMPAQVLQEQLDTVATCGLFVGCESHAFPTHERKAARQ